MAKVSEMENLRHDTHINTHSINSLCCYRSQRFLTCGAGAADVCWVVYLSQRVLDDLLCFLHSSLQTGPASCYQLALQSLLPALLWTQTHTDIFN